MSTYADIVAQVHADLRTLPLDVRRRIRYLSLYALPKRDRADMAQVLDGHCNGLSRETSLVHLHVVPKTEGALLRLNLDDYGWKFETWERLHESEPYFQVRTVTATTEEWVPWSGGVWTDGKTYAPGSFKVRKAETGTGTALAPWLSEGPGGREMLANVVEWTFSRLPIVDGEWFMSETATADGKKVGYYEMLGVKDLAGWEKLVRFDATLARDLEHRRTVVFSGITLQPRRIERVPTVLGAVWRTRDSADATDKHNPLRLLDDTLQFDAQEAFAPLPNGLPAWLLADAKGKLQAVAPPNVVGGDRTGRVNDTRLHVGLSCIRCHFGSAKYEQGIRDFNAIPIRKIKALDPKKLRELSRLFLRNVEPAVARDRADYRTAVKAATGWETQEYAEAYGEAYGRYDGRVTPEMAARRCGVPLMEFVDRLMAYDDATGNLDPLASILVGGASIPRRQFEEVFPVLMTSIRSIKR